MHKNPQPDPDRIQGNTPMPSHRRSVQIIMIALIPWLAASIASADLWAHPNAQRTEAPHVHGLAHLTVATEDDLVHVELICPAASLVGFERAPRSDEERATIALAKSNLLAGDAMIRFNTDARCRMASAAFETGFDDAPASGSEHTHSHSHQQGHDASDQHADVVVTYQFICDQPDQLGSAALGLFAGFPAVERILVSYVTAEGQGRAELTPRQAVVNFVPF
ncbi:DUF2796 domain-containing protein [Thiocapsa imhoffii]|nr:DUF2796 domain-containing protein [Thiocapsa imhoffii]